MGRKRRDSGPLPDWAARIVEARIAAGFRSQRALAEAIPYSQQRIADWEAGRDRPNLHAAIALQGAIGVPIAVLLPPEARQAFEMQQAFATLGDADDRFADLVAALHDALKDAGERPSLRIVARLARSAWRLAGGTEKDAADEAQLAELVNNLRQMWRDVSRNRPTD